MTQLDPRAQAQIAERIASIRHSQWKPFYCTVPGCDGKPHGVWTWPHARADQHPPKGAWAYWMNLGGRGAAKTRTGSEWVQRCTRVFGRIACVAPTGPDFRATMVEGESGLLATAHPEFRPLWEPSKKQLTYPNGAVVTGYSAEEPDRLRGPEHHAAWCDEPAFYAMVQQVWDNLLFGLRLGRRPRVCLTTTPKPRPWLRSLLKDPALVLVRSSTYDNLHNLSPVFAQQVLDKYEGTRLGRQEIHAEILDDVEGSLWTWDMLDGCRVDGAPTLRRIVVGVDPAGSKAQGADETGIVVVGIDSDGDLYVLDDRSGHYSPHGWATAANAAYDDWSADAIVAEKNFGGEMVEHTLRSTGYRDARILVRQTRRSKALRAEPVVGRYEQGKVHHVGSFTGLEEQMTTWQPYETTHSPDRVDALVYAATEVMGRSADATMSSPTRLRLLQGGSQ
jgi:phage terminase large subunit-like protein